MSRIKDYLMKLEEEDKASDDPHRILTKDSLPPTKEEQDDYKDCFKASLDYFDFSLYPTNAKLLPQI